MKSLNDIEKTVKEFNVQPASEMKNRVLTGALATQNQRSRIFGANTWRFIMTSKPATFAAAALLMAAVILGINALTVTPAWAIEQTIEALRDIRGIYFAGTANYPGRPTEHTEIWTRPHSQNAAVSGDFRLHEGGSHVSIASESQNTTWVYTKNAEQSVVYVTEGLNRHCLPFPTADLFDLLRQHATDWKEDYRRDPETGRDSVFVTCKGFPLNTAPYWRLEFDLKTKFPVRAGVWYNSDYSGLPHFEFTTIIYNPQMPDDLFEFAIPQDAKVIECGKIRRLIDTVPDYGIKVESLSTQQACIKVAQEYWQAVADRNVPALSRIRPLVTQAEWDGILAIYDTHKPLTFTQTIMNHLNDPATFVEVTCMLTTQDGQPAQSTLTIDIRQTDRGTLGVVTGVLGPELILRN
jgi:outer membrane lipoprotein-sorting protein